MTSPREPDAREALADRRIGDIIYLVDNSCPVDGDWEAFAKAQGKLLKSLAEEARAALRQPGAPGGERERIAFELWQRFAPVHHVGWKDETHKAEYYAAADAILAVLSSPPPSDERAKVIDTKSLAAGAIRTFCKSLGAQTVVIASDGDERIYYSGLSLDALAAAVALALSLHPSATRVEG